MRQIILIAHNLRSAHNVGSLLRTADGLAVSKVWLTGHTPYPILRDDERLPHIARKVSTRIAKTSLGAENTVDFDHNDDIYEVINELRAKKYTITALEQSQNAIQLPEYKPPQKIALILGREVEGVEPEILDICEQILEIPMLGQKESFNVSVAAAMALYTLRFAP